MASRVEDCGNSDDPFVQDLMKVLQDWMEDPSANSSAATSPASSPPRRPVGAVDAGSPQQRLFSMLEKSVRSDRPGPPLSDNHSLLTRAASEGPSEDHHRLLEAEAEIQRLRSQMDKKERQMHELVRGMVKSVELKHIEHQREVSVLKDEVQAKQDEVDRCRSDFQDIAEENHKLKTEDIPNMKAEHFASQTELERVKADSARAMRLEQNVEGLISENSRLKQVSDKLQEWKRNAESKHMKDGANINQQAEQLRQHQAALQGVQDECQQHIGAHSAALKRQESIHAELQAKAKDLATADEALRRSHEERNSGQLKDAKDLALARKAVQELEEAQRTRHAELAAAKEQHAQTAAELAKAKEAHQHSNAQHNDELAKAKEAQSTRHAELEAAKEQHAQTAAELAKAKEAQSTRHAELAAAKEQHSEELAKAKEAHKQTNAQHNDELAKAKEAHQLSSAQLADTSEELAKVKKAHQDALVKLLREIGAEEPSADSTAGIEEVLSFLRDFSKAGARAPARQLPAATFAAKPLKLSTEASFAERVHHFASVAMCVPPAPSRFVIAPPRPAIRAV